MDDKQITYLLIPDSVGAKNTSELRQTSMKFALLVSAFLVSSSPAIAQILEVTTDLGEKCILIDSAEKATPMTAGEGVACLNSGEADIIKAFEDCAAGTLSRSSCAGICKPD